MKSGYRRVLVHNHIVHFGVVTFFSVFFLRFATFLSFSIVSYSNSAPYIPQITTTSSSEGRQQFAELGWSRDHAHQPIIFIPQISFRKLLSAFPQITHTLNERVNK